MERSIDEYIDPAIIELIKRIGCDECHSLSLKIIKDFSKFIDFVFNKKETVTLILSSFLSEKEELANVAKDIGKRKQVEVYVFFSDSLSADSFAICCKPKSNSLQNV